MNRMTPNWTWTLNSQHYRVSTKYLPQRPKFWSVSIYDQRIPGNCTFYISPLTPMFIIGPPPPQKKEQKKKIAKNPKFEISQNSLYNFGRYRSHKNAWIFGSKAVVYFQTRCKLFLPYGPTLTKKNVKNPKFEILRIFIQLWYSMHEFLEVNLLCIFRWDIVWSFFSHMVSC